MIGWDGHSLVLAWAINITAGLILLGAIFAFVRLIRGPSLADRVVCADAISVLAVALAGVLAVASRLTSFIDVAIALALVAFLATVAFAWYADQRVPAIFRDEGDL